ncbi:hypothetical protein AVEN_102580-1 [Araneus ventricosus]|uniref:Transposable element P transposase-like RNase H domain-containing protein n=1 Tax=Araneus ventricosus TaxID=182803 RepID=A0A4Y2BKW8_ARAVE|nr:hypothetical protein AVEN_102580-1 [Araneus ventricosus]
MLIYQKPPQEIAISGGIDETADFSKASDVLECDDVENDMRVLTSTPKRRPNFTEKLPDLSVVTLNGHEETLLDGSMNIPTKVLTPKRKHNFTEHGFNSTPKTKKIKFLKGKQTSVAKNGRRFSLQDKILALQLYLASPKAYGLIRKYFCLASKKTLRRSLAAIDIEPGFIPSVEKSLKLVASKMTPLDKLCILSFDEMKIKMGLSYHKKMMSSLGMKIMEVRTPPS